MAKPRQTPGMQGAADPYELETLNAKITARKNAPEKLRRMMEADIEAKSKERRNEQAPKPVPRKS